MTKKVTREMKKSSSSISERLLAADAYNKAHYERDPLHKKAADTIDELVSVLALCRGDHFPAGFNARIDAALRRARGEE